jgi:coatomer subunit beta
VAFFIREMISSYPKMHATLLEQLRDSFYQLQSTRVCTTVLWILAEYSTDIPSITAAHDTILAALGPPPFGKDAAAGVPLGVVAPQS